MLGLAMIEPFPDVIFCWLLERVHGYLRLTLIKIRYRMARNLYRTDNYRIPLLRTWVCVLTDIRRLFFAVLRGQENGVQSRLRGHHASKAAVVDPAGGVEIIRGIV